MTADQAFAVPAPACGMKPVPTNLITEPSCAAFVYVVPSENLGESGGAYDYTKVRDTSDLGQCLERSYGTTEKSLCRFQYGTSPVDKARGIIGI